MEQVIDPYIAAVFKTIMAFVGILVYARILGKQQMSQLTFYDYITGITFGNIAAMIAIDPGYHNVWLYFWILTVFAFLNYLMGVITEKSRPLRKLIEGEPVILIHNGKILEHNMAKARYNMENLLMQLREKDIFDLNDVEFALAETDGQLTVLKKPDKRPATPNDFNIKPPYEGIPSELVIDGKIIYQNLKQNNKDEAWLISELKKLGYNGANGLTYVAIDQDGNLFVDEDRDRLDDITDISD